MHVLLGVDTGGTFTDFVWFDGERLKIHKVLSTPDAPERAILQGIRELGLSRDAYHLVHGSTVATNAVLEGKGVRTVYITNYGLGDVLTIGRQARRELYNLQPRPVPPPVPAPMCLETGGRLGADGSVVEALSAREIEELVAQVQELKPQAVAINLLFSYLDDGFERQIEAQLPDTLFVSRSSDVLPEHGEYERGIATWLNAWVGPMVEGYVRRLQQAVQPSPVHVMQSSALTIAADQAARRAVNLLLSGPAGGLMGALRIGDILGRRQLLTFDMGGTSTDVALLDGRVSLTSEGRIGGYPVAVPMVDMHTIGAGGGSIARVDDGGMLVVGPESAGADPGPACYGQGGLLPTVTDANLVLGRLRPSTFLGGNMVLDSMAAYSALERLASQTGLSSPQQAAQGIIDLADEHMAQALRVISIQRGLDPSGYTLTAFGGAGGLHVCALAEALGMIRALVPIHAGVLSALGMLVAPRGRQLSHTLICRLTGQRDERLRERLQGLQERGQSELQAEGIRLADIKSEFSLDVRYFGQSFTLNIPYRDIAQAESDFHVAHRQRFGHRLDMEVELVNLRVGLSACGSELSLGGECHTASGQPLERAALAGVEQPVPVWRRDDLANGAVYRGPLLIVDDVASTWVAPGWAAVRHESGCVLLERQ
ncbi:MAG: hydantoinase/oxoprolinase family protein [Gammaproteobacteria bacterium]|nr:MAG: hydantoinase/oxoprolinase family protein [Gammaproteobacteria bacterium]